MGRYAREKETSVNIGALDRAETLLAGEHRVLEMIAARAPLHETLDELCRLAEQLSRDWLASILLLDAEASSVWHGAAPTLPEGYASAIDGARIGPAYGPCGLAALGHQVVATDIAADPRCSAEYRGLALEHGLRACWSTPIKASNGRVLGVLEIYLRQPGDPSAQSAAGLEPFAHLAAIAIELAQAMPAGVGGEMLNELRRSKEELQRLMASVSDYLWSAEVALDGSYTYRYYSPVVERITGWPPEKLLESRSRWVELLHPLDRRRVDETFRSLMSGATEQVEVEYRIVRPDGALRWVRDSAHGTRAEDGRILLYGVVSDITERKLGAEALRESEARFRALTELSSDWYWEQDESLRFTYLSSQVSELTGHSSEPSLGRTRWELPGVTPISSSWEEHRAALAAHRPFRDFEYSRVAADGTIRHLSVSGAPVFDEQGRFKGYQGVGRDITGLRRLEKQLRLAQRLEAMGTLAGGIAHDFNNILGVILGYGEMARRAAPRGSRLRSDLDSIMTAGERGRALVDRVLAFSTSGLGERVAVHVEKVVREALDLLGAKLPEGIRVEAKLGADRAAVLGDATQVHQVMMNLVTNAMQAMPAGGTLSVSLDAVRGPVGRTPTIGAVEAGEYVVLTVADTGTGIAPEIIERIFDPFFTTKEVGTGTGLGLSLVHGIVTELGGAIDVASTPGQGSAFTVYLPRSGDVPDSFQGEEPELPRGAGQQVLIVDDEEPLGRLVTRTLEELGYAPSAFTSGSAALAAFRADPKRFDAVITDERMPEMTGSALIDALRAIRRDLPILLISGFVGDGLASRAREAGADEVLKKPMSGRELAASLARLLRR
jgi:PAS domain S-box-containing protein